MEFEYVKSIYPDNPFIFKARAIRKDKIMAIYAIRRDDKRVILTGVVF